MSKYTGLICCLECSKQKDNGKIVKHKFKGRKERNNKRIKIFKNECITMVLSTSKKNI